MVAKIAFGWALKGEVLPIFSAGGGDGIYQLEDAGGI
jgi:hypothetical protein